MEIKSNLSAIKSAHGGNSNFLGEGMPLQAFQNYLRLGLTQASVNLNFLNDSRNGFNEHLA